MIDNRRQRRGWQAGMLRRVTDGDGQSFLTVAGDDTWRAVVPVLREFDRQADEEDRLSAASVAALMNAGIFRLGTPRNRGGLEASVRTCLEVTAILAHGSPAASWVAAVSYGAQHVAASFGERVRSELWGDTPDVPMSGSFHEVGAMARKAPGGQVVSGKWPSASGAYQATWALVTVPIVDEADEVTGRGLALVPLSDLTIEDSWDLAGMRGSGSHTVVADRCFVPDYRIRPFAQITGGGQDSEEPLYRVPLGGIALTLAGPLLGAAEEIFDLTMRVVTGGKPMSSSFYKSLADSPGVRGGLADAATLIDTARLHLFRSADYLDAAVADGGAAPTGWPAAADLADPVARARVRMDMGHAASCLRQAASLLLDVGGASSLRRGSEVERLRRDLETGSRHPMLSMLLDGDIYGRALVGDTERISPLM
jgi:3-hydroxy-9,10-secoandrosta-1,3,5(10)-triene-9,17-dione monooxygenase